MNYQLSLLRLATLLFGVFAVLGCSRNDRPGKKTAVSVPAEVKVRKSQIRDALAQLLERKPKTIPLEQGLPTIVHRPFVVVEDADSKKFVQVSGSNEEALMFDLPLQALNVDERARAEKMFAQMSIKPSFDSYSVDFGKDVNRAADLTVRVFQEIYKLPDNFKLKIRQE